MPTYDYVIAQTVLTETEKNRIVCIYLSGDTAAINNLVSFSCALQSLRDAECGLTARQVDWDKATTAFGSASTSSMKVSLSNSLKKVADKGGKDGADGKNGADPSPAKGKAGPNKKRKAGGDGDADDEEATPKKRGGGRKKKVIAKGAWTPP